MHKWLPNLVAKFWLPNLVLYQTDKTNQTDKTKVGSQNFGHQHLVNFCAWVTGPEIAWLFCCLCAFFSILPQFYTCDLLCDILWKRKNWIIFMCLLEFECAKRLMAAMAHSQAIPAVPKLLISFNALPVLLSNGQCRQKTSDTSDISDGYDQMSDGRFHKLYRKYKAHQTNVWWT